jgi:predicted nucleic acid binding AN1-type Zn finger protein
LYKLTGFPCRCGGIFCSLHRYANEHDCTFDYREHGAEEIRKNNPQIIGEKIKKIWGNIYDRI